ncbi:MAG: HEAT repeat domain-containing protein [Cyanobacteria bacterium P01_D01_bin.44]
MTLAGVMDHFGEPAIYALHFLQKDNDPKIRALYAKSLSKISSKKSIQILFKLLDDHSSEVRARAILSLSDLLIDMRIREHDYLERFYRGLDLFLAEKDLNICKTAVIALARLSCELSQENPKYLDSFFLRIDSILKNSKPELRKLGIISLTKITVRLAKYFPVCCEQFFARIDSVLEDSDSDIYNLALCSLAKVSLGIWKDALFYPEEFFSRIDLILLDTSRLSDSFRYVIIKMRELGNDQAIEKMRELLTIDSLGLIAATNLADIRSEESLTPLIEALDSPSYRVRENAVRGLYYAGSIEKCPYLINAVDRLIRIVNDSRSHIPGVDKLRRSAIATLANIGPESAMDAFSTILRDQQFASFHLRIIQYLGKFNSSKSIELLIDIGLFDSNLDVRRKSFTTLEKHIGEEQLIAIIKTKNLESTFNHALSSLFDTNIERKRYENKSSFSQLLAEIVDKARQCQIDSSNGRTYAEEIWKKSQELWKKSVEIIDLAEYLPDLKDAWIETENKGIRRILNVFQSKCKFYNYEIFQAHREAQQAVRHTHPDNDPNAITIQTLERLNIMTDKPPIFHQQHATIGVNYAADGSTIEFTQHTSSSEHTFEILLTDYKRFIEQLQQKYPTLADLTTVPQIIEVEAKLLEAQDQQRWQNFLNLKRLWNGSKQAGIKVGEHFAENNVWAKGAIAFLEGVSEDGK